MASYFLFPTYAILFSWLIYKSKWVRSSGLPIKLLVFFFILKILAGCIYGYWYSYQEHADTWSFHAGGLAEYELLFEDPWHYFTNLFHTDYPNGWGNIFANENSDWNDLKDHLMIKFISVMNIFSFGNYYVNVVIYSFITFFGFIFLYKGLTDFYGNLTKVATFFLFLTPSCLFWTSGLHKDGLILFFIGLIIYQLYKILIARNLDWKSGLLVTSALILLLLLRSYVMLAILPPIIAMIICYSLKVSPLKIFVTVYAVGIVIFFLSDLIHPNVSLPQRIVDLRLDFQKMTGGSSLYQTKLEGGFISFLVHIPEAIDHAILRPYLWQAKGISEVVAGLEVFMFLVIILVMALFHRILPGKPIDWFLACFSLSLLLFIGFVVSFSGAMVRYRAIYLMIILVVSCQYIDHRKLISVFQKTRPPELGNEGSPTDTL